MVLKSFEDTLVEISAFLDRKKIPYMVIGGIANAFWGIPRATLDIDMTLLVQESNIPSFIEALKRLLQPLVDNPVEFLRKTRVLPCISKSKVRIDLIFAQLPYEEHAIQRSMIKKIMQHSIKVCTCEDLIIHKAISEREKDWEDIKGIIQQRGDRLDLKYLKPVINQLAHELQRPEIKERIESYLKKRVTES